MKTWQCSFCLSPTEGKLSTSPNRGIFWHLHFLSSLQPYLDSSDKSSRWKLMSSRSTRDKTGECLICIFTGCSEMLSLFPSLLLVLSPQSAHKDGPKLQPEKRYWSAKLIKYRERSITGHVTQAQRLSKLPSMMKRESWSSVLKLWPSLRKTARSTAPLPQHCVAHTARPPTPKVSYLLLAQGPLTQAGREPLVTTAWEGSQFFSQCRLCGKDQLPPTLAMSGELLADIHSASTMSMVHPAVYLFPMDVTCRQQAPANSQRPGHQSHPSSLLCCQHSLVTYLSQRACSRTRVPRDPGYQPRFLEVLLWLQESRLANSHTEVPTRY